LASQLPAGLAGSARLKELRERLLFLVGALVVYRTGTFIPVPGIDPVSLKDFFERIADDGGAMLDVFNMFSGGALMRVSIFALGIMPYISASIVMQLLTAVVPFLEEIKKEGESGRRKITQYTRYGAVGLATFQAIGAAVALQNQGVALESGLVFIFTVATTLVSGTIFLMWLGEQITERGIGNGISMLIFAGIVAGLPSAIGGVLTLVRNGEMSAIEVLLLLSLSVAVTAFVVFVERAQRRIPVHYAKRQRGRRMYGGQVTHMPLKINMAGVIPPIFASSIIIFPATLGSWFGSGTEHFGWMQGFAQSLSPGQPLYILLYAGLIIFFCFFYTGLVFNARETSDNLKKSGAYIPGIRPGLQTANYIDGVQTRLTVVGSIYIALVALFPEFLVLYWSVPFYFGGTSLLIIVVVTMDFMAQMQGMMMSQQYDTLIKKANLGQTPDDDGMGKKSQSRAIRSRGGKKVRDSR